jgi:hypothetical protein
MKINRNNGMAAAKKARRALKISHGVAAIIMAMALSIAYHGARNIFIKRRRQQRGAARMAWRKTKRASNGKAIISMA